MNDPAEHPLCGGDDVNPHRSRGKSVAFRKSPRKTALIPDLCKQTNKQTKTGLWVLEPNFCKLGVVVDSCNTSTWKAETGLSQVQGQSGLHTENLTPNLKTAGLEKGLSERESAVQAQGPECGPQDTCESQAHRESHACNHSTGPRQRQVDPGGSLASPYSQSGELWVW